MKKNDLKAGYVVETASGRLLICTIYSLGLILNTEKGFYLKLDSLSEDLQSECYPDLSIVRVYGYSNTMADANLATKDDRPLLWERKEKSAASSLKINDFVKEVHENAVAHGWWEEERTFGDILSLCHSELSEALEEYRNGKPMVYYHDDDNNESTDLSTYDGSKIEGIATELIDCVIRIFDFCGKNNIDVEWLLTKKHEFNKTRSYKHGDKVM